MLPLTSPLWSQLHHAYGNASDIPDLLRRLESAPTDGVAEWAGTWKELFEALCHGGVEVHSASYAALPYFVRIGRSAPPDVQWAYLLYVTNVEALRLRGAGPPVPEPLADAYFDALNSVHGWVYELSRQPWDFELASLIVACLAAVKGQADLASFLMQLTEDHLRKFLPVLDGVGDQEEDE